MTDRQLIEVLMARLEAVENEVSFLRKENDELRERLADYENPKNSRNSSVPPSKDENRPKKNQSLREISGKKVGGQPGHRGCILEMASEPDTVIDHSPEFCDRCGSDLTDIPEELAARRQVVDIPPIVPHYTEHRTLRKKCPCGHLCEGAFPENVRVPISYGPNVQATATYIVFSENRGIATIEKNFPSGLPNAVLVHDCWASHFRTACRTHQLCTAHLLRELVYFTERYASQWAMEFREPIHRGLKLKKKMRPDGYGAPLPERDGITEKMSALLDRPLPEKHKDLRAFHKRMIKYRDYIFAFLHHYEVRRKTMPRNGRSGT